MSEYGWVHHKQAIKSKEQVREEYETEKLYIQNLKKDLLDRMYQSSYKLLDMELRRVKDKRTDDFFAYIQNLVKEKYQREERFYAKNRQFGDEIVLKIPEEGDKNGILF